MASIQKEINNADSHMTLQSLTVIKDIKSKGFKTIKTELESVKKSTQQFAKKQNEFWNNISSDGIVAVNEKTLLKKEWQQIDQTHTAILKLAQEGNLEDSEDVKFYDEKYNALYEYLFSTLKLFDDMSKTTNIANRDKFNSFFADYYEAETEIQTKLAIGMVDVQGMRILDNLGVIGLKDEIAIYLGKLYQYVNNEWVLIPSDGYLGIKDNCPTGAIGQFFLAGDSEFYYPIKIKIGESFLQTTDGRFILATKKVEKGFIYAFTETGWVKIIDKNDYRYIIAINDLITLGESLSDNLQGIFDAINGRLDDAESSLKDKIEYVPSYLGMFEADPKDAKEGDWYVYNGVETTERNKGKVYLYQMNTEGTALSWVKLTPADTNNSKYFMAALNDILASMDAEPGYFSEVFCNAFFANAASISALQTKTISLSSGGMIKSNDEIYEQYKTGMCISSNGNADFNGNTHIGGSLSVDGDTYITGAALFTGSIKSGPLELSSLKPANETYHFTNANELDNLVNGGSIGYRPKVEGNFQGYTFSSFSVNFYSSGEYEDRAEDRIWNLFILYIDLYDIDGNHIYEFKSEKLIDYPFSESAFGYPSKKFYSLPSVFSFKLLLDDGVKTFKLDFASLPKNVSASGIIYVKYNDGVYYLAISP